MKLPHLGDRYRIERSLGAGGMGEVFLAHDEQLGRRVALKRLTPRADDWESRRARFRKEARIAAKIKHAAVVQVFDVLHDAETDYIVMEYVEGANLRVRITRGPSLSLGHVLHVGRQIASGMAEAHSLGIVHRDLKTENVLVNHALEARISDFGIAKVLGEESWTQDGRVLGTHKAMSPEQARGADIDTRTDLFSFGVLLYETLAGTPPFTGRSSTEIFDAVLRSEPPPLARYRPDVPPALVNLIAQLLQKSRELRPAGGFRAVEAVLAELAVNVSEGFAPLVPGTLGADSETLSLEEPAPELESAPEPMPEAEPRCVHAADAAAPEALALQVTTQQLLAHVSDSRALSRPRSRVLFWASLVTLAVAALVYMVWPEPALVGPDDLRPVPEPPAPEPLHRSLVVVVDQPTVSPDCTDADSDHIQKVRNELVAALVALEGVDVLDERAAPAAQAHDYAPDLATPDEYLALSITCHPGRLVINLDRIEASGILRRPGETFEVERSDIGVTSTPVHLHVLQAFDEYSSDTDRALLGVRPEDIDRFLEVRRAYWQRDPAFPADRVLGELARIRSRSPGLVDAYRFEAELWNQRYAMTHDEQDYRRAWLLLTVARMLEPRSVLVLSGLIALALDHGDLEQAEAIFATLHKLSPASGHNLYLHALIKDKRGDTRGARDLLEEAATRHPSWRLLYHLARVEVRLGEMASARKHVDRLLEMSPDNRAGQTLRALMEVYAGEETGWCRGPIDPSQFAQVNTCAVKLMAQGQYGLAALLLERARALNPRQSETAFNLGEALKLDGQPAAAARHFRDVVSFIPTDTRDARRLSWRALALAHLELRDEARQEIEEALARSPDDGDVRYNAAATYALIGDREATVRAVLATPAGSYDASWFRYPWFDSVRGVSRLRTRMVPRDDAQDR